MAQRHDVIVIGSGIGGLTAALTCARKGRDVCVLEAGKQFGGFINPFQRKGYWFDAGIHYVGECGPGQSLHRHFERLGLTDTLQFRELSPDGFDRYSFPDYEVRMGRGAELFRDRLIHDFPHEQSGIHGFFRLLESISATLGQAARIRGLSSALRLAPKLPILARYYRSTYSDILDGFVRDKRLRAALAGPSGDLGLPPGKVSGLFMMGLMSHFLGGAYFPVGGQKAVRDAYVDGLKSAGATLKRNTRVDQIMVENGSVSGVRTDTGEEFRAPIVISNADATVTLSKMLDEQYVPRSLRKRAIRTVPSLGSLCVFLGLDAQLDPVAHGLDDANIWSYPSYDIDALYQPALDGQMSSELPFFMTVPTLKDPTGSHAPPGRHTVELITFAPWQMFARWQHQKTMKRDSDYLDLKNRLGEQLVSRAERYLPGLSQHIEVMEVATPATNVAFVNTPQGSIYGADHTPDQVALGRFRAKGPVDGLYLCGASVIGCGIATCVASGALAAKSAMTEKRTVSQRLRSWNPRTATGPTPSTP